MILWWWLAHISSDIPSSTYRVSNRKFLVQRALVDRGATNGTVGGSDWTWIGGPVVPNSLAYYWYWQPPTQQRPYIGTVDTFCNSNRCHVICIFNEVAYTAGKHQSIISSIQLEHYTTIWPMTLLIWRLERKLNGLQKGSPTDYNC